MNQETLCPHCGHRDETEEARPQLHSLVLAVRVGCELFRFESFPTWVNKAADWFSNMKCGTQYVCIDAQGRVCQTGRQFMRARDEGTFPVVVYSID